VRTDTTTTQPEDAAEQIIARIRAMGIFDHPDAA
jgi:hypothetical protein